MSDWKSRATAVAENGDWKSRAQVAPEEIGQGEAFLRGAGQGLSLGYEDELRAALLSKFSDESYEKIRDDIREKNRLAQEQNPWTYGAGNVAGSVAPLAIPGVGVAEGATMLGGAAKAAALGGVAGYGSSEAKDVSGQVKDTLLGAGMTGGMQLGGSAIAKALPSIGKGALKSAFGVSEDTAERYLANPEAVNAAKTLPEIAEDLPTHLNKVRAEIPELSESAGKLLSGERSIDKGIPLQDVIAELDDVLGKSSDPSKLGILKAERDNLLQKSMQRAGSIDEGALSGQLTEQEVKGVIKKLADAGDFKNPLPTSDVAAINSASGRINAILKTKNPEYAAEVEKLADRLNLRNSLIKKYGLEKGPGGYTSSDRTISALKDLGRAGKMDRAKVAEELASVTGADIKEDVLNSLAKSSFDKDLTRGSRNVNLGGMIGNAMTGGAAARAGTGAAVGGMVAGPVGMALGGAAGAAVDVYGGKIGKAALDATSIMQKLSTSPQAQKFVAPIQQAISRGSGSLGATHFLLYNQYPEYRRAFEQEGSGN